jgi:hypothetical protein
MPANPISYNHLHGKTYLSETGKWSWVITVDDQLIDQQTGFCSEAQADEELAFALLQKGLS